MLEHSDPPIVKTEVLEQPKEENETNEDLLNSDSSIGYNPALQGVLMTSCCDKTLWTLIFHVIVTIKTNKMI